MIKLGIFVTKADYEVPFFSSTFHIFLGAFVVRAHHVLLAASSATEDVVRDDPTPTMSRHSLSTRP